MVDINLNWLSWFHFLILEGALLVILIDYISFLSPFLDVIRMSMSTVSFLALPIKRHLLTVGPFETDLLDALIFLYLFFLKLHTS